MRVCVCVCVCARVRACVRVCVLACVRVRLSVGDGSCFVLPHVSFPISFSPFPAVFLSPAFIVDCCLLISVV